MESRVLSRATTLSSLPSLRRSFRESSHTTSFVSIKPIGAVGKGGNLIWGRQLRPSLLLESSPVTKRETLRPILAVASSPAEGSDSPG
ncbi:triose phosphate/phosphate translocator, chloroplastic-like [Mercurialis annua]|uniref:triose phosphate/phosphate translocator, chloroplastic-like n=1 Tax=Mercurialis annua TaxID=3986 RepID=UPI002160ADBC|nr:triose phosphate/phosphate translocator, chloroplastic-like [Mercurialis annua]